MTTARKFVYKVLTTTPGVTDLVGEDNPRIFAKKTMTSSREQHPYIVYKLGNEVAQDLSEERQDITRQFVQIWVHDFDDGETADYAKIDEIISAIKQAFNILGSAEYGVWITNFVETSQDLNDDTLSTVFRYIRLNLVKEER